MSDIVAGVAIDFYGEEASLLLRNGQMSHEEDDLSPPE